METLRTYLKGLDKAQQAQFAEKCGTTIGYLRKVISTGQDIGLEIVIAMERESRGQIRAEEIRPNVDWAYLRKPKRNS